MTFRKILVIRYGSLGDLILTTAPIRNLRISFPESEIFITTKNQYEPVVSLFKDIDGYIPFQESNSFTDFMKYLAEIRNNRFDLAVDLHNSLRSRIMRKLAAFKEVLVYDSERKRRLSYLTAKDKHPPFKHTVEMYNAAIKTICSNTSTIKPMLEAPLGKSNYPNTIGIVTSAKHDNKKWVIEYFKSLISSLLEENHRINLICDPQDIDFFADIGNHPNLTTAVSPNLTELTGLVAECNLVVCNDSGPMHLAVAFDIPVISVFGPTHPCLGFYPLGDNDQIVTLNVECSPCSLHGDKPCYQPRRFCMENIKPEMVLYRIYKLIKER